MARSRESLTPIFEPTLFSTETHKTVPSSVAVAVDVRCRCFEMLGKRGDKMGTSTFRIV
jgi:hypothetical protein